MLAALIGASKILEQVRTVNLQFWTPTPFTLCRIIERGLFALDFRNSDERGE